VSPHLGVRARHGRPRALPYKTRRSCAVCPSSCSKRRAPDPPSPAPTEPRIATSAPPTPWPPPIRRLGHDRSKIDPAGSFLESSRASSADSRRLEPAGTAPPPSATAGRPGPPSMAGYRPCPATVSPSLCSPSPPLSFPPLSELAAVPGRRQPRRPELPAALPALRVSESQEEERPGNFAFRPL
jgi:hypothetical protein